MFDLDRKRPDWDSDGRDWPNRAASQFLRVGSIRWHVQIMGAEDAPPLLLLHGTGSATHSFRDLLPLLAQEYRVIAPDMPGHGFTDARSDAALSLPGMASALTGLCDALAVKPIYGVGHSAGAAVLLHMDIERFAPFERLIGINAALAPIEGNAILSPLAKLLFVNPFVPALFAKRAGSGDTVRSLLSRTNSTVDEETLSHYTALARNPAHVAGALGMMANWDLHALQKRLGDVQAPTSFIVAEDDSMVPPAASEGAAKRMADVEILRLPTGGHLLHEVDVGAVLPLIQARCQKKT